MCLSVYAAGIEIANMNRNILIVVQYSYIYTVATASTLTSWPNA